MGALPGVAALGRALRAGDTTAVQLSRVAIEALERDGRALNAVAHIDSARALREAERADAELAAGIDRGPLHGIPWGAKDLLAATGGPTTWGAAPLREQVFDFDATVVRRLEAAGAVLVAKLSMIELAGGAGYESLGASWTGPARNPHDPDAWAGGSSSGSGAAVGAGLLPFAIGTETLGSILVPSAFCGITGLRPTYGRVSRYGAMALAWSLDKVGPMARSAEDCALVLEAIAGPDPHDSTAASRPWRNPLSSASPRRFRFGVAEGWREGVASEVVANTEASLEALRELGTVETVELPDLPYVQTARIIIACEAAGAFSSLIESGRTAELTCAACRYRPYVYSAIPAADYLRASRIRRRISAALDRLHSGFDALVAPSTDDVAPSLEGKRELRLRAGAGSGAAADAGANLAGLPAVSVPNGTGARGLPTGLRFTGRAWSETRLLEIAHAFQSIQGRAGTAH